MCNYNEFIEDYNNPDITAHDVRRIHNLNSKQYSKIRKIAISNGDIPPVRHMNQTTAKFYSKKSYGTFEVQKQYSNADKIYVGRFPNRSTAEMIVEKCKEVNWELNKIEDVIIAHKIQAKNYSIVNGYYVIQKSVNGRNKVFCCLRSDEVEEEVVKQIVDEFRNVEWNIDYKDEILDMFDIV